jgi:low affinity Fe/Cu permease
MPGIETLDQLTKSYGFTAGLLIAICLLFGSVIIRLYRDNQRLHDKLNELLDARGKFLDSILTEAIDAKAAKRVS